MSNPSIMNNTSNVLPRINMTADFNRAVFVNNEGTRLVKQCQYDAAVKSFTTVLKILKPLAAIVENNAHQNSMRPIDVTGSESTTITTSSSSSATSVPLTISFTNSNNNSSSTIMDSSSTNTNNPTTETAMAQIHLPPPSTSPSPVRPYSSLSGEQQQQQQQQKKEKKNISELEGAAVAQQQKLLGSSQLKSSITTSDKLSARKPSYFVFREPVEIPPGSVQRKKRKATSMMMSDNNNMDVDENENENETLEDELLYYTPGLFSKFLMVTMYNLALTLHLHALSLSTPPSSKNDTNNANNSDNNNTNKIKKLFLRSRKLYELSFEMHLDESCDVNLLFTLALINNLGLVYYTLNENKRSQTCFKNMFSTMMYLMDTNESSTINEWDGLLSNVMDILFYNTKSDCSMYEVVAPAA